MIWCTNEPNAHIRTFGNHWSFTWRCLFPVSIYKYKNLLFLRNPFHKSHLEYYEGWQGDSQDSKEFWGFQDVGRDLGAPRGPRVVRVILEGLGGSRGSCESQVTLESKDWVPLFHHALFTQDKPGKESGMRLITSQFFQFCSERENVIFDLVCRSPGYL